MRESGNRWRAGGWLAAIALAVLATLPVLGASDGLPPLPRPRPDRAAQPGPPVAAPGQESEEQKRIREGIPDIGPGSDSIFAAAAQTAVEATKLGTTPEPVTLSAELTEKGARIADGLVWRVYSTKPDKSGKLAMVAKSQQASPTLRLKPGDYVVHVAYGRAQASDTISVRDAADSKAMILDAGGLKLNALITGDLPIPFKLLHFDIFAAGTSDNDRALVAEKVAANDIVTLNAGTYHVVSYFGDVNAVVRADLRVEPGQLTDATLYQKAAEISFKLVSQAGGEAIADVDWVVKSNDGQAIFTNTGTFPSTVLEEGTYTVTAKRGSNTYSRSFQVKAGPPVDIEVVTTAG